MFLVSIFQTYEGLVANHMKHNNTRVARGFLFGGNIVGPNVLQFPFRPGRPTPSVRADASWRPPWLEFAQAFGIVAVGGAVVDALVARVGHPDGPSRR